MEAVLPIEKLQGFIDSAMERYVGANMVDRMIHAIDSLSERPNVVTIDGHEFAVVTAPMTDQVNGNRQNLIERGLAL